MRNALAMALLFKDFYCSAAAEYPPHTVVENIFILQQTMLHHFGGARELLAIVEPVRTSALQIAVVIIRNLPRRRG
jgi:hypothetical protein